MVQGGWGYVAGVVERSKNILEEGALALSRYSQRHTTDTLGRTTSYGIIQGIMRHLASLVLPQNPPDLRSV